jgi:hypothetical protein
MYGQNLSNRTVFSTRVLPIVVKEQTMTEHQCSILLPSDN